MSVGDKYLLVISSNPETAAQINSLIRNSGINIQLLHADQLHEAQRLAKEFSPILILFQPGSVPAEQVGEIANHHNLFCVMRLNEPSLDSLFEVSGIAPVITVASDESLVELTGRLSQLHEAQQLNDLSSAQEAELEDRFELLMNSTRDPIAYFHEGLHVAANQAYLELIGADDLNALASVSLLDILNRQDTDLKALLRGFSRQEYPEGFEAFRLRTLEGEECDVQVAFAAVQYESEPCVQLLIRAEDHATDAPDPEVGAHPSPASPDGERSFAQVTTELDSLTGMYWRRSFLALASEALQKSPETAHAAMYYIQPDDFEQRWNSMDISELDRYVAHTAEEILSSIEENDLACRFSESTFVLLAHRADRSELKRLGERIRAGVEQSSQLSHAHVVPPACSIGMVMLDGRDSDIEHLLGNARSAWHLARAEGNSVIQYRPARAAGVSDDEESEWRSRIRFAIDNEDFYTVQHGIMNLEGDGTTMVENRTFMRDQGADFAAAEYLAPAERNQLASQIDRHIIPGILRAASHQEDIQVINISANSMQDFSFPAWFQRALQEIRVPGKKVIIQCPADAAGHHPRAASRLMDELSPMGVRFSLAQVSPNPKLDNLLEKLELSFLTLAPELLIDISQHSDRMEQIRNVVRSADRFEIKAIASGVDTSADLAVIWKTGVKYVSGEFMQDATRIIGNV